MNSSFQSIQQGLKEAIQYSQGKNKGFKAFQPSQVDVKAARKKANLTQEEFSSTFGISLGTLRHWERGDRKPRGPALVLLNMINKDPETVLDILHNEKVA
ncbi:MAG: helix-turn-helix domain-containing protein [SAR324 cluster bacterium]|nr:helix-turn-helix domain-containing protein [SAR324 cluster bacterium]